MDDPRYWDRLTASLAAVELRDLDTVWRFLAHTGVIEHARRGAFQQVIDAVTTALDRSADGTQPARIAIALRGLQTARGSQLDPGGAEARAEYEEWKLARGSRTRL